MKLLIAIHEIVRGTAKGRETIAPGQTFRSDGSEVDYLLGLGAAKLSAGAAAVEPDAEPAPGEDAPARDLSKLKKAELLVIAKELAVEGHEGMTVAQLIEAIEAEEAEIDNESMI